jgi:cyclopropane-fatty-acyl-phospholipid synthase
MMLSSFLRATMHEGTLVVIDYDGVRHEFGDGQEPRIVVRFSDKAVARQILLGPELGTAEAYMDGRLTIEEGDLYGFLALATANMYRHSDYWMLKLQKRVATLTRWIMQFNPVPRAKQNVAHHYDLSDTLYDLFLDPGRQYSCAYFAEPDYTLEQAQLAKKNHIASKLLLKEGLKVLDIGCGWGGLAFHINEVSGAETVGITLSEEQLKYAQDQAARQGLAGQVQFRLQDYRQIDEKFDRIVSVGMFEHVGVPHYGEYFRKCADLLKDDGVMLLHTIGRYDGPGATDAFTRKYIFPGGYSPALSEIAPYIERAGLVITDVEILRLHYASTLREWRKRFLSNRDKVKAIYDERFCRMWEFYLTGSELAFRYGGHCNFQIQIAKDQHAVPLTRDYIGEWEKRLDHRAAAE